MTSRAKQRQKKGKRKRKNPIYTIFKTNNKLKAFLKIIHTYIHKHINIHISSSQRRFAASESSLYNNTT